MNKIISPIVLAVLLVWTWHTIHAPAAIGFETHSGIQLKLMELIESTLQAKKPEAKDLEVIKIWTSSIGENKVKANFAYRFTEPGEENGTAKKTIQGEAVLHREPTEDATIDKWVLQSVNTQMESLNFTEGSEILPEPEGTVPTEGNPSTEKAPTENQPNGKATTETEKPAEKATH
jgi:hypothetical protein